MKKKDEKRMFETKNSFHIKVKEIRHNYNKEKNRLEIEKNRVIKSKEEFMKKISKILIFKGKKNFLNENEFFVFLQKLKDKCLDGLKNFQITKKMMKYYKRKSRKYQNKFKRLNSDYENFKKKIFFAENSDSTKSGYITIKNNQNNSKFFCGQNQKNQSNRYHPSSKSGVPSAISAKIDQALTVRTNYLESIFSPKNLKTEKNKEFSSQRMHKTTRSGKSKNQEEWERKYFESKIGQFLIGFDTQPADFCKKRLHSYSNIETGAKKSEKSQKKIFEENFNENFFEEKNLMITPVKGLLEEFRRFNPYNSTKNDENSAKRDGFMRTVVEKESEQIVTPEGTVNSFEVFDEPQEEKGGKENIPEDIQFLLECLKKRKKDDFV